MASLGLGWRLEDCQAEQWACLPHFLPESMAVWLPAYISGDYVCNNTALPPDAEVKP